VTGEVLALPNTTLDESDDVEAIWGRIFAALSTPKLLQKIAGRRLGPGDLRFVLLSCLLSTAVSEGCLQRVTYISRIMGLPNDVQHTLMMLIETFPKTPRKSPGRAKTPTKSPARSRESGKSPARSITASSRTPISSRGTQEEVETPRSSGSRRDLDSSFASVSRNSTPGRPRRSFTSIRSLQLESRTTSGKDNNSDLVALTSWIRSFPQMSGLGSLSNVGALDDMKVSL
jgi:hypothetical protein